MLGAQSKKPIPKDWLLTFFGRGGGIRTHDPLLPKQMRYQAALRPEDRNYTRIKKILLNRTVR